MEIKFLVENLLAIDPGIDSMGWAYWIDPASPNPSSVGLVKNKAKGPWWNRVQNQVSGLLAEVPNTGQLTVFCEMPVFFASAGGYAAASTNSIQKLSYIVGALSEGITRSWHEATFTPVTVREWKGQLTKEAVKTRITRLLGVKSCSRFKDDIWDSVGLGLYIKGVFK